MIKRYRKHIAASLMMLVLSAESLPAQEGGDRPQDPVLVADMSIEKAIDLVLKNNLAVSSAGYGMAMTDTEYRLFIKKYSPEAARRDIRIRIRLPPSCRFSREPRRNSGARRVVVEAVLSERLSRWGVKRCITMPRNGFILG